MEGRFCSEPVALHGWYMGGIASLWFNMFKNTELVRGLWCSVVQVICQACLQSDCLWLRLRVSAVYGTMAGSVFCMLREPCFLLLQVGWMHFCGTPGSTVILLARKQNIMPGIQRFCLQPCFGCARRPKIAWAVPRGSSVWTNTRADRIERELDSFCMRLKNILQHWPNPSLRVTLQISCIITVFGSVCMHVLVHQ